MSGKKRKKISAEVRAALEAGDLAPLVARLLAGEEPNSVFGWGAPGGRPKDYGAMARNWRIAVAACRLQERMTLETARSEVAAEFKVSESTVKRAWERHHEAVQYLLGTRRPPPARVRDAAGNEVGELDIGFEFGAPIENAHLAAKPKK